MPPALYHTLRQSFVNPRLLTFDHSCDTSFSSGARAAATARQTFGKTHAFAQVRVNLAPGEGGVAQAGALETGGVGN